MKLSSKREMQYSYKILALTTSMLYVVIVDIDTVQSLDTIQIIIMKLCTLETKAFESAAGFYLPPAQL